MNSPSVGWMAWRESYRSHDLFAFQQVQRRQVLRLIGVWPLGLARVCEVGFLT